LMDVAGRCPFTVLVAGSYPVRFNKMIVPGASCRVASHPFQIIGESRFNALRADPSIRAVTPLAPAWYWPDPNLGGFSAMRSVAGAVQVAQLRDESQPDNSSKAPISSKCRSYLGISI
jgi:hypothetical protein